jgi:hypothetical protein
MLRLGVGSGTAAWLPANVGICTDVCGTALLRGACSLCAPRQGRDGCQSNSCAAAEAAGMDGLRATGPAGLARSAAAAGHGIINESDDIVACWRQELPGGDLNGSSKGILVN